MSEPTALPADGQRPAYALPADTDAGKARLRAMAAASVEALPTSLVGYRSEGYLLVIGPEPYARSVIASLDGPLHCAVLAVAVSGHAGTGAPPAAAPPVVRADVAEIQGHIGQFTVTARDGQREFNPAPELCGREHFDLVLDLQRTPSLRRDLAPPGYYAPAADEAALQRALVEIPQMVGEFEKPRYFSYNPDICAHGARGLTGCTRCLDVCPAGAITSAGEKIEVDPYLCHGIGACATACPSGAIAYAYPSRAGTLERIRLALGAYREAGGVGAKLLLHDAESGGEQVARVIARLPENVVPLQLEEVGSAGMDVWLAALAYGAAQLSVLVTPAVTAGVIGELERQMGFAGALVDAVGLERRALCLLRGDDDAIVAACKEDGPGTVGVPATFAAIEDKRRVIQLAVDHLAREASNVPDEVTLPNGAPFGRIEVDAVACTLCMACVAVCPAAALADGIDLPQLNFTEWNCVQCGLCENACPENAITRNARFLFDAERRRGARVLHEEQPFCCVACGKPFATRSMMARMEEKLRSHRMFQGQALERLKMCEDCRVKDMFASERGPTT